MKPKVLQIAFDSMDIGGVQKNIIDYAENLPGYHFDVVVFVKSEGRYESIFRKFGGRVFRITEYDGNNRIRKFLELFIKKFRIFFETYKIIRKHGPYAAIHSNNQFRSGFTNAAAFFAGVKVRIAHSHNDKPPAPYGPFKRLLLNIYRLNLLLYSNVRLACSLKSAEYLFWKADSAEIILNGSNMEKFDPAKYPSGHNETARFIHVGRYDVQKNQMFLLDVFSHILKKLPGSILDLIGFGRDEDKIRERVKKPDLIGKVEMHPPDSDVPMMMSKADFMIFPSLYEGFPNVHIEAQLMGVRCFLSDAITRESDLGLSTYISLGKDPAEWAEIIINKTGNHDFTRRPEVSQSEKNRIDISEICKRLNEIYKGNVRGKD